MSCFVILRVFVIFDRKVLLIYYEWKEKKTIIKYDNNNYMKKIGVNLTKKTKKIISSTFKKSFTKKLYIFGTLKNITSSNTTDAENG